MSLAWEDEGFSAVDYLNRLIASFERTFPSKETIPIDEYDSFLKGEKLNLEMKSVNMQHDLDRGRNALGDRIGEITSKVKEIVTDAGDLREEIQRWSM